MKGCKCYQIWLLWAGADWGLGLLDPLCHLLFTVTRFGVLRLVFGSGFGTDSRLWNSKLKKVIQDLVN